jgi:6-phospho-beta-glucosidase
LRKVAVIGGGGFRTPRLLYGLVRHAAELQLEEVMLYDPDPARVAIMSTLGRFLVDQHGAQVRITTGETAPRASRDATFVLFTFRPGGEQARLWDERVSVDLGVLGQETVGPGGFFSALRAVTAVSALVDAVRAVNPAAWLINFTNPVGIVSEAMARRGVERFVGVCDTPYHLQQELAAFLGAPPAAVRLESVGLNHLGWVLRLWHDGRDRLPEVLARVDEARARVRPLSFFTSEELLADSVIPTEYVYLYLHADEVWRRQRGAPTRGEDVLARSGAFFAQAAAMLDRASPAAVWDLYRTTLVGRSNSYLQRETATPVARTLNPDTIFQSESYERVAIDAMLGLCAPDRPRTATLSTPSLGIAAPALARPEVGESTCFVDGNGVLPLPLTRAIPATVASWISRIKRYEVATAEAAATCDREAAVDALALNPIVSSRDLAHALIEARIARPPHDLWGSPH